MIVIGKFVTVLSVQNNHKQWEDTVYVCYQSKVITDFKRLLFVYFISLK